MLSRRRKEEKARSNLFHSGDSVIVSRMFFRNHGLKYQELGKGIIKEIVPIWESTLPAVKVIFDFSPMFLQLANNGYLKVNTMKQDGKFIALVRIHPVYLEKIKK